MDFDPIVKMPCPIDPRIFLDDVMELEHTMLGVSALIASPMTLSATFSSRIWRE